MDAKVLSIFLKVREGFSEINERVSLLKTYFQLHVASPGVALKLDEFEKILGFKPEVIYRSKETGYGISVIYTISDDVTKGIMAHEFAELVARETDIHDHEAIDEICFEKGYGEELLLALESVLPGRVERAFIDGRDLATRIHRLRESIQKNNV